jgi:cystathionine gamma-lyase
MEPGSELRQKLQEFISQLEIPEIIHKGFSTKCVHAGQEPELVHGSVNTPIHMSSTFKQKAPMVPCSGFIYTRVMNPTTDALDKCIAELEYGKYCRSYASGIAAVYAALSIFKTGDHIILSEEIYIGTYLLVDSQLKPNAGIDFQYVNFSDLENIRRAIRPNTKLIFFETPSNPQLTIYDIEAIVAIAKEHNILTAIDNTFASPYLQSPLLLGVDISIQAVTKYIGGHCDISAGAVITNNDEIWARVFNSSWMRGDNTDPMSSFLALRGVKTLKVRMTNATRSAFIMAHWFAQDPRVERVCYPGLKSHEKHDIAVKQMRGFGAMLTLYIKGADAEKMKKLVASLKRFVLAGSLGGVKSLVALHGYSFLPKEKLTELHLTDNLLRLSIGQENVEDLIEDIDQALAVNGL